jgi:twinkle protein
MKITNLKTGESFDIDLKKISGEEVIICPACSGDRKKKNVKCLSWNHEKITGKCHHCDAAFVQFRPKFEKKEYVKPVWDNNTQLTDKAVKYFEGRGISQFTLREMKVTSGIDWMPELGEIETIHFNYFKNNELVNIKYRGANKTFRIFKDAELVFYNIDSIKNEETVIIVEGEIDQLSLFECGFRNTISVPNGAKNFKFLDNCWDELEHIKKVIIAVDNDEPGFILRDELIRRLGSERCFIVDLGDKKDANEYLTSLGKENLILAIENAKEIPIDGVIYLGQVWDRMLNTFRYGKRVGTTTYLQRLDSHWRWRNGEVNIWTGYNNEGKSCFLTQLCVLKSKNEKYRHAVFCPENYPVDEYYDEVIHCLTGRSTDKRYNNVLSENEYLEAANFVNDHFFTIVPDDSNYQLDNILGKMKRLIRKYGVNSCIIDPYNQIDHLIERGQREDLYISQFMTKLKKFAIDNDISFHLVAHQVTPLFQGKENYPQPDIYKIKGGGTFADKADNVISVWRPFRKSNQSDETVRIIVGKIKKVRLVGTPGEIDLKYNVAKNQYSDGIEKEDFWYNKQNEETDKEVF